MITIKCTKQIKKKGVLHTCDRFLAKIMKENTVNPGFQIHLKCPACGNYAIVTKGCSGNMNILHVKEGEGELCQKSLKT